MKAWNLVKNIISIWRTLENLPGWGLLVAGLFSLLNAVGIYWKQAPWPVVAVFGGVAILLVLILAAREKLELRPSSGPASTLVLTVTNRGSQDTFRAQCEVQHIKNTPNDPTLGSYTLRWMESDQAQNKLGNGSSASLLIAEFALRSHQGEMGEMLLPRFNVSKARDYFDNCRWNIGDPDVPEYGLRIRISGERRGIASEEYYTLRPQKTSGPLELIRA